MRFSAQVKSNVKVDWRNLLHFYVLIYLVQISRFQMCYIIIENLLKLFRFNSSIADSRMYEIFILVSLTLDFYTKVVFVLESESFR